LDRGTRFTTTLDQTSYNFTVLETASAPLLNGVYTFSNIEITQGILKRMVYRVDNTSENQKFTMTDDHIDTSTMRVRIKANEESSEYSIYTKFSTLVGIDETSQIYYLQENSIGTYEIYFGDGVLGKKPIILLGTRHPETVMKAAKYADIGLVMIDDFMNNYSKFNCFINLLNDDYGPGTKLLGLFIVCENIVFMTEELK
jgi:hypothetical protein